MENGGNKLFKKDSCIEALYRKFKGVCKRPCYHTVCQKPTLDRSLLSRDDYLNILSTPRGYVWTGLASYTNNVANNANTRKVDMSSKQQKRDLLKENVVVSAKEYQATITQILKTGKLNAADQKVWERLFKKELAESPEFAKEYQTMINSLRKNGKLNYADKKKWEELFIKKLDDPESTKEYQSMANHTQKSIIAPRMQKIGIHSSSEQKKRGPILIKDKKLPEYPEFIKGYQKKISLVLKSGKLNAADQKMWQHLFKKELAESPEFSKEYQMMLNSLQKHGKLSPADQKKWEKRLEKKLNESSEFVKEYQSMANHMKKNGKLSTADEEIWGHMFKDESSSISEMGKKRLNQGSRQPTNNNESKTKNTLFSSSLAGDKKKFKKDKQKKLRVKSIQNSENEKIQKEELLKKETEEILNVKKEMFLKAEKKRKKEEEKLRKMNTKLKAREEIIKKNAEKMMVIEERKRLREEELKKRRRDVKQNEDAKRTEIIRIKKHEERVKLKETIEKIRKLEALEREAKRILQEEEQWRQKINREFAKKMGYTTDPNNCIIAIIPNLVNNEDDYKIGKKGKHRFVHYTKWQLEKIKKRDNIFDHGNLMKEIIQRELANTQNKYSNLYKNEKLCNNQSSDLYRKTKTAKKIPNRWIRKRNVMFKSYCSLNNLADFNEMNIKNKLVSHKHCRPNLHKKSTQNKISKIKCYSNTSINTILTRWKKDVAKMISNMEAHRHTFVQHAKTHKHSKINKI